MQKLKAAVQRTPNTWTRPSVGNSCVGQVSVMQPWFSPAQNAITVTGSAAELLHVQLQAADTSTHL